MRFLVYQYSMECMLLLLFLSSAIAAEQNLKVLPPPPIYSVGGFTSPNTSTTQVFRPGSQMNVSWYTEYPTVNLYLIYGQNYATPYACISTLSFQETGNLENTDK